MIARFAAPPCFRSLSTGKRAASAIFIFCFCCRRMLLANASLDLSSSGSSADISGPFSNKFSNLGVKARKRFDFKLSC